MRSPFLLFLLTTCLLPLMSHGQQTIRSIIERVVDLITLALPVVVALTLLFVLWGGVKHIFVSGDAEGREKARQALVWGVIILFVMVSVWGIVAVLRYTFF